LNIGIGCEGEPELEEGKHLITVSNPEIGKRTQVIAASVVGAAS
jgi:hypothetical protein